MPWGNFLEKVPPNPFKNFPSVAAVEYGLYDEEGGFLKYTGL